MEPVELTFGEFRLNVVERSLWKGRERLSITPKSLLLLLHLAQHAGCVVDKKKLVESVWANTHVSDGVVKVCIAEIRRVLGDNADAPRFIETAPRQGYRFITSIGIANLPVPGTTFIGREREISDVERLIAAGRLVTLQGAAGVGKTRLAGRVASNFLPRVAHGVWWIDLSPVVDSSLVVHTVASVLGVDDHADSPPTDGIIRAIRQRELLIVLDNCEHLVRACSLLAESLLRGCPNIRILATSREPLGTAEEVVCRIQPLFVPDESASFSDITASEAVRLFVERATSVNRFFTISDDNASAIAHICRRLDGLPLAIELAAARVTLLSPRQIAARVENIFGPLGSGADAYSRHHTLEAAIDSSFELLSLKERVLLTRLSVFSGSFTLAAAEFVCGGIGELETSEILDLTSQLIDRSLVTITSDVSAQEMRYRLLGTIRQYARDKLPQDIEAILVRRHAEFFMLLSEEIDLEVSTKGALSLALVHQEYDNLRAALQWARHDEGRQEIGLRIATALCIYWGRRGQWREGQGWFETILKQGAAAPRRVRARALCAAGELSWFQGNFTLARIRLEEGVRMWRTSEQLSGLGRALGYLGEAVAILGDPSDGERLISEAINLLSTTDFAWDLAVALNQLGWVMKLNGRFAEAESLCEHSATILRGLPDSWTLAHVLSNVAALATSQNQYDRADAYLRQSLVMLQPLDENWTLSRIVEGMALVSCGHRHYAHAARLLGAAEALEKPTMSREPMMREIDYRRCVSELRSVLGDSMFHALQAEGRQMSRDEIMALSLAPEVSGGEEESGTRDNRH